MASHSLPDSRSSITRASIRVGARSSSKPWAVPRNRFSSFSASACRWALPVSAARAGREQDTASVRASIRLQSCFPIRLIVGNLLMFVRLSATAVLIIIQTENGAKKFRPVRFF